MLNQRNGSFMKQTSGDHRKNVQANIQRHEVANNAWKFDNGGSEEFKTDWRLAVMIYRLDIDIQWGIINNGIEKTLETSEEICGTNSTSSITQDLSRWPTGVKGSMGGAEDSRQKRMSGSDWCPITMVE
ncbi:LOW QUALITY PROTEIN: hypothetical protein TorRG33x02_347340 [Trema orientale]|uniref:Uncharacterized protein n=1 Tax=Trema orientale TaxID=63057 RepID=A0A2P5ALN1_TREOI|nr:LOW QUALITY PROTEIN: hypothetical protein TorRG33x02_347340 [Trema orientale]